MTLPGIRPVTGKVAWIAGDCFGLRFEPAMLEAGALLGITKMNAAA